MRIALLALSLAAPLALAAGPAFAQAQSETDRLRDALRSAIAQTRALEDQRNALNAKVTESERKAKDLQTRLDATKAELKDSDAAQRQAVTDFNARLEERNQALEKWKDAYGEAATVARSKDSERAKFEAESKDFQERTKTCQAKNANLVKAGRELLARYRRVHLGDAVAAQEPVTGIKKVEVQNTIQDFNDRILDEEISK